MSELLGLRWGDIDFVGKKIMLNQTWGYGRIEDGNTEESREPVVLGERTASGHVSWNAASLMPITRDGRVYMLSGIRWRPC